MFWERFYDLCMEINVKPNFVAKEIGLSTATCTDWKKNGNFPKGDVLIKLADYLDVSADYLLGLTDEKQKKTADINADSLTPQQAKAIEYIYYIAEHSPDALPKIEEYARFLLRDTK